MRPSVPRVFRAATPTCSGDVDHRARIESEEVRDHGDDDAADPNAAADADAATVLDIAARPLAA